MRYIMLGKKLVKLKEPKEDEYYDAYVIYKDKPCYVHDRILDRGVVLLLVGDKGNYLYWYPAELVEYISGRLIRCDIKIV